MRLPGIIVESNWIIYIQLCDTHLYESNACLVLFTLNAINDPFLLAIKFRLILRFVWSWSSRCSENIHRHIRSTMIPKGRHCDRDTFILRETGRSMEYVYTLVYLVLRLYSCHFLWSVYLRRLVCIYADFSRDTTAALNSRGSLS